MLLALHRQREALNVQKAIEKYGGLASMIQDAEKARAEGDLADFWVGLLAPLPPLVGTALRMLIESLLYLPS